MSFRVDRAQTIAEIASGIERGLTAKEVARAVGKSHSRVFQIAADAGLSFSCKRRRAISALLSEKAMTAREVAHELGLPEHPINTRICQLRRQGVVERVGTKPRPGAFRPPALWRTVRGASL